MSFDLVFFGSTGDLTRRKLMPALFQALRRCKLPEGGRILEVARDERSDDEYRRFVRYRFVEVVPSKSLSDKEFFRREGSARTKAGAEALRARLRGRDRRRNPAGLDHAWVSVWVMPAPAA